MNLGPTSSSKASQTTTNVSGSGQNIAANKSGFFALAQGGATLFNFPRANIGNDSSLTLNIDGGGERIAELSGVFATHSGAQNKLFADSVKTLVSDTFKQVSDLAQNKQSEGVSSLQKTFLWLALGSLGILAWIWSKK